MGRSLFPEGEVNPRGEEIWFCPNCGEERSVTVKKKRLLRCEPCKWVFDIKLHYYLGEPGKNKGESHGRSTGRADS